MEYKLFGDTIIMRLDPEEEICEQLTALAAKENIMLAEISGLGAVKDFTTGVFDPVKKEYFANHFQGTFEIVSLCGTLTRKEGTPYLHVHMSAGDDKGNVFGGHLNRAVISATAELVIRVIEGKVDRHMSEKVGLNLLSF
jgi:predicted DNA-binding protein with PD1-like motif